MPPIKRLPCEINWFHSYNGDNSNVLHIDFFNFLRTFDKRRAPVRFLEVVKCIADEARRRQVLEDYDQWRKSRESKDFWSQRGQIELSSANSPTTEQTGTSTITTTTTTEESVETISLADAKAILIETISPIDNNSNVTLACQILCQSLSVMSSILWTPPS